MKEDHHYSSKRSFFIQILVGADTNEMLLYTKTLYNDILLNLKASSGRRDRDFQSLEQIVLAVV